MIQIWLHNNSGSTKTYSLTGDIENGAFYQLQSQAQRDDLAGHNALMGDVASGDITISVDGITDIDSTAAQMWAFFLRGQYLSADESNKLNIVANKGSGSFETIISHDLTDNTSWPATDNSTFEVKPGSGEIFRIEKAEVQFSHDIIMNGVTELYFDVWVYNPLFDSEATVDADDPTFIPGVSSGNPLYFLYERQVFKSIRDVLNKGNEHYTMPAVDGMVEGMTTVQFNYPKWIELKSSQGGHVRINTKDDIALTGEFCTVSFLVSKVSE